MISDRSGDASSDASAVGYVDHRLVRAAAVSWRVLVVAALVLAVVVLLGQLLVVVVPVAIALLVARALVGPAAWLERRGVRRSPAALIVLFMLIAVLSLLVVAVGAGIASEFDELGSTVGDGISDVEDWLVDESPFDVDRDRIADFRQQIGDRAGDLLSSSGGVLSASAIVAVEIVVGSLLALVVAFFFIKDRRLIVGAAMRGIPVERRPTAQALADRAWSTLGAYLRGVALLGIVEATIIGFVVWVVGGRLVAAVVVVTLLGAFVPIVGAVAAGVVAVLVTLATAGAVPALIVAAVTLVVQQLDNDLLGPIIYGRSMALHPLVILLTVAAGTALFGIVGAVLALPMVAVGLNVAAEWRDRNPSAGAPVMAVNSSA